MCAHASSTQQCACALFHFPLWCQISRESVSVCVSCSTEVLLKQQWGSKLSNPHLDKDHRNCISNLKWTRWTFGFWEFQLKEHFPHLIFPGFLMCSGWQSKLSKSQSQSFMCWEIPFSFLSFEMRKKKRGTVSVFPPLKLQESS